MLSETCRIIISKLYFFYCAFLQKQIFTYLLESTPSLNLKIFAGIVQIVRSQLNLSANVSYNSRRDIGGYLSRKLNV